MLGVLLLKLLPTEQSFLLLYSILEGLRKPEFCFTILQMPRSPKLTSGSKPSVVSKDGWSTKEREQFFQQSHCSMVLQPLEMLLAEQGGKRTN